ncbi:NAD(P)/FAD-dependent oxidoreductase [Parapedomonas caeni]
MTEFDAIILGAGAAGLFCAATAGQRGRRVLLLDHADQPGRKILISGGGRCNFTNLHASAERYLSDNPHFAKSALGRFTPADFIALVDRHCIAWHEKTLGQLFCDGSARQIVAMLADECGRGQVDLRVDSAIRAVDHRDNRFHVRTDTTTFAARALVIATGGPSIPKMGATGVAYDIGRRFGLGVVTPRPGLVPLTLGADDTLFRALSGVATEVIVSLGRTRFREAALFTHKGLSGPAILQISSYWKPGDRLGVNFLPGHDTDWLVAAKRARPRAALRATLAAPLPQRLAEALADRLDLPAGPSELGGLTDKALSEIAQRLADWPFTPSGTEGFAKAEVTVGGLSTADLSSKTMEARQVPGLFAIGEAVDVTGWLGGYNFQWAWASAWAAAQAL